MSKLKEIEIGDGIQELKLSNNVWEKAERIYLKAYWKNPWNKDGIKAAAVYYAATVLGEKRTQNQVALVFLVSDVTIRTHLKRIEEMEGGT